MSYILRHELYAAQVVCSTSCMQHRLYAAQVVCSTSCMQHKLYAAQVSHDFMYKSQLADYPSVSLSLALGGVVKHIEVICT